MRKIEWQKSALQYDNPSKHLFNGWAGGKLLFLSSYHPQNTDLITLFICMENEKTREKLILQLVTDKEQKEKYAEDIYRVLGDKLLCQDNMVEQSIDGQQESTQ